MLDVNHCLVSDWFIQEMFDVQKPGHALCDLKNFFRSSCYHLKRVCNLGGSSGVFFIVLFFLLQIACVSWLT